MENKDFQYFKGTVDSVTEKEYTKQGETTPTKYWAVSVKGENGEIYNGAIFDCNKFKKTPETINELVGTPMNGSFIMDEQNRRKVFLFGPRENKKNFLQGGLLTQNEYSINLKNIFVFQSQDSKNIFVSYKLNPETIKLKAKPADIQVFVDNLGWSEQQAKDHITKKALGKKEQFKDFDWSIIEQITSVGPNKNGKKVEPKKLKDGRIFDRIKINTETLASVILKAHNSASEQKWNKKTTVEQLNKLLAAQDVAGLKEMIKEIKDVEVFLTIKNGNPTINPNSQFGRIKAFEAPAKSK